MTKKADKRSAADVLDIGAARNKKNSPLLHLLRDSRKVATAITTRTCMICNLKKSCVGKAGVCGYCFEHELTDTERTIAEEEARHKKIKIEVVDDRW